MPANNITMKRYIYIIIGIIVAAVVIIALLFFLKGNSSLSGIIPAGITGSLPFVGTQGNGSSSTGAGTTGSSSVTTNGTSTSGGIGTQSGNGQSFGIVFDGPVLDYSANASGTITVFQPSGAVVSVSGNQSSTLSQGSIDNIISAKFSYDGKKLLVSFGDPSDPSAAVFDVTEKTWTSLPQGMQSPQWSPAGGYQIAFLSEDANGSTALGIINAAAPKSGIAELFSLDATDLSLQWISKNQFVLSDRPSAQTTGSSWIYNSQTKALTSILYEMSGVETIWGGTSTPIGLAFFTNPASGSNYLRLMDQSGTSLHDLNFMTMPTKCAFNNETTTVISGATTSTTSTVLMPFLYCGVPTDQSQLTSAQLPDDYNDGTVFTSDKIIKLNTATGDLFTLWNGTTQDVDATDIKVVGNSLYLINRYDQKLYALTPTSSQ